MFGMGTSFFGFRIETCLGDSSTQEDCKGYLQTGGGGGGGQNLEELRTVGRAG